MELLELHNITKEYPGVTALDDVSINFKKGEVHALVGENGAGKSTFIKVISGAIKPTSGIMCIDGKEYKAVTPLQAIDLGIAVVYQELVQFDAMSIMDNLFMSSDEKGVFVDEKTRFNKAKELLAKFHCDVSPKTWIRELSVANRQIVEIAKGIVKNARILILDEPTAAITVEEQKRLFKVVNELKEQGVTIIYISHRLEELFEICDRVTVLRDGKFVDTLNIEDTNKQDLIKLMVGRELSASYPKKENKPEDEVVLSCEHVSGNGVNDINFELHKGEILGFAGLVGAGRTELMHLIYGNAKKQAGVIKFKDKEVSFRDPSKALDAGISLIPEDRKMQGCFLEKQIDWNISISSLNKVSNGFFIDKGKEKKQTKEYGDKMKIKTPSYKSLVLSLSGGNQQKVVLAKSLTTTPDILIFDEPTRGIDVGARYEIYQLMIELTRQGKSILMVSSDMEELLGMSERIVVLHEGTQMGVIDKEDFSQERVMTLASGEVL